jgi:helicase required for RNAi-mediated heterochromatin assembly 1
MEQLQELEAEAVAQDDDDIEALRGEVIALSDNFTGRGSSLAAADIEKLLSKTSDLTTIPPANRGAVYNHFMRKTKQLVLTQFRKIAQDYDRAALQRQVGRWEEDVRILRDTRIIGMTTTGLSKYRALLTALHPRVVMVEEAAETMEAPVTVACMPSLEHLLLVGDHQQLRPHTQVREFEDEPFYLNLSLFERLVYNDVAFDTLTRQRRMIPEIRRLLYPIYSNTLKDHSSVEDPENRPPIRGMGGTDTFFFSHEWPEDRDSYMSCVNPAEAKFIAGFFEYLVLNGEDPNKITVLTFYNGQRKRIIGEIRARDELRGFMNLKVVTVDSYQGEE